MIFQYKEGLKIKYKQRFIRRKKDFFINDFRQEKLEGSNYSELCKSLMKLLMNKVMEKTYKLTGLSFRKSNLRKFSGPASNKGYFKYLVDTCQVNPQVFIELTSMCNFHCYYCNSIHSKRKGFIEKKLFYKTRGLKNWTDFRF